jgi:menaquinone-specific isochorismate synthase
VQNKASFNVFLLMEWNEGDRTSQPEQQEFDYISVPIAEPEYQSLFNAYPPPYFLWSPPGDPEYFAVSSTYTIKTEGKDRFDTAVSMATQLAANSNPQSIGPTNAQPRLFGGAAFNEDHTGSPPWTDFPDLQFSSPRIHVTHPDPERFLTVTEPTHSATTPSGT